MKHYSDLTPLYLTTLVLVAMCGLASIAPQQSAKSAEPVRTPARQQIKKNKKASQALGERIKGSIARRLAAQPAVCPVHHVMLQTGVVPIHYGRYSIDMEHYRAGTRLFPYANLYIPGGCDISSTVPKTAQFKFCFKCREAEAKWRAAKRQRSRVKQRRKQ